jgi:hypothetical protein
MGALQTLRSELRDADYLVSISGGGYTSGALAQLLTDAGDDKFDNDIAPRRPVHDPAGAYMPGSVELDHVRRHSSYIATTATQMFVALAVLARGLLATLLLLFAPAVALGVGAAWFYYEIPLGVFPFLRPGIQNPVRLPLQNAELAVAFVVALALLAWLIQIATSSASVNAGNVPSNAGQQAYRLSNRASSINFGQWAYGWSSRASVFLTRIALITAVLGLGVPALVWACEAVVGPASAHASASVGGSVGTVLLTYLASIASIGWRKRKTIQKAAGAVAGKGSGPSQKAAVPTGLLQLLLVIVSVAVLCASWLMLLGVAAVGAATDLAAGSFSASILWAIGAVLVVVLVGGLFDETSLSLHPFYRRRLASAFATRAVTVSGPGSAPTMVAVAYDPSELTPLSSYARPAKTIEKFPEFIFAAAANLTGEAQTPPGLNAVSFTMSADWVGGPDVGWVDTATLERACSPRLRRDVTVQAAVAISGAAFASAMGRFAAWYQIVLAVSGARLGAWLPNPAFLGAMAAAQDEQGQVSDWTMPHLPSIRRATYLLRELFNIHPARERLLQVTDGGHYENLGIVELLRRRCTTIYCIDGGGDSPPTAPGLAEAIALAEMELGVQIKLTDPFTSEPGSGRPLKPDSPLSALNAALSREPVIAGTILYPPASGLPEGSRTGHLYVARALLWPEMPYPLLSYAAQNPVFPHDSTGDQWFDDDQFTAYTQLGRELGKAVRRVRDQPGRRHTGRADHNGGGARKPQGADAGNGGHAANGGHA